MTQLRDEMDRDIRDNLSITRFLENSHYYSKYSILISGRHEL